MNSFEESLCLEYLAASQDEQPFDSFLRHTISETAIILAEGFEDRSLGLLRRLSAAGIAVRRVALGRYVEQVDYNSKNRDEFERQGVEVAGGGFFVEPNRNDGKWVENALEKLPCSEIILDISGISNRSLFTALDAVTASKKNVIVAYTEAQEYWPRESDLTKLRQSLDSPDGLAEAVDKFPCMFSYEHTVEIIEGHGGYSSAGSDRALIAFLPFKCARLASVVGGEDYSDFVFIAGCPLHESKRWRLDAVKEINRPVIGDWKVVEMDTFGYRKALKGLTSLLFDEDSRLLRYDAHLAVTGSKLQSVACWALSSLLPSLTCICSVPRTYYPEAFSKGVGETWLFRLKNPLLRTS